MKPRWWIWILLASCVPRETPVRAQEFSAFVGGMETPDVAGSTYAWQIEFRRDFWRHASWSLSWINEGHVNNHHRDGWIAQGWANVPFAPESLGLSLGVGLYRYFDTQLAEGGDSSNIHGWSPVVSFAATHYTDSRWFFRLLANWIPPPDDIDTLTLQIGAGYWLGDSPRRTATTTRRPAARLASQNEFTVYFGKTIVNTRLSGRSVATSVEYRRRLGRHFDWTLGLLNEGDPAVVDRLGVATQLWLAGAFLDERLSLSFGFGIYVCEDDKRPPDLHDQPWSGVAGLMSPSISYRFSENWHVRFTWHRVSSDYNRDSDVFLLGCGYRWGR